MMRPNNKMTPAVMASTSHVITIRMSGDLVYHA